MEPAKPVHLPWIELDNEQDDTMWEPNWIDTYSGPKGGPKCGPSDSMQSAIQQCHGLFIPLFLLIFPMTFLTHITNETRCYAYEDWVEPRDRLDCDWNVTKKKFFAAVPNSSNAKKRPHENA